MKVDGKDLVVGVGGPPGVHDAGEGRVGDREVGQVPLLQLHEVPDELAGCQVPESDSSLTAGSDDVGVSHDHATRLALKDPS